VEDTRCGKKIGILWRKKKSKEAATLPISAHNWLSI
jgi:hypothetical protein